MFMSYSRGFILVIDVRLCLYNHAQYVAQTVHVWHLAKLKEKVYQ